jgi:hypothetical protein
VARAPVRFRRPPVETLAELLARLAARAENASGAAHLTVGEFVSIFGRRAYGPLLLAVGLFSISPATIMPGMTWLAGGLSVLIALQMTLGADHLWLPGSLRARKIPIHGLAALIQRAEPWARRIDAVLKPRLVFLSHPPGLALVGVVGVLAGLLTFPLGFIPAAPLAPGIVIVLIGLGVTTRDGIVLLAAICAAIAAVALALRLFW